MNRLASILPVTQVLVSVDATSKKRAFEEAGLLFEGLRGLSRALVTDSLFARERLGSTGLGHGVAIPHGRIKGLKAPMAAVFQLERPIGFDAPDEQPVVLLIFLLVPEAATQKHLRPTARNPPAHRVQKIPPTPEARPPVLSVLWGQAPATRNC